MSETSPKYKTSGVGNSVPMDEAGYEIPYYEHSTPNPPKQPERPYYIQYPEFAEGMR